jgi:hypothetical protein
MGRRNRKEIIDQEEIGVYHCYNSAAQGLYLCGYDAGKKVDNSHRRQWFIDRLIELSVIFVIDIGIYSILSTHFHVILRNRPDLRNNLTDEQVIRRWRLLYPRKVSKDGAPKPLTKKELKAEVRNKKRVAVLRKRLSDISWMMKSLCEPIAKRANAEATVKGHFFAGRFESIRLLDEEALVACASYVDLNEVRAKLADLPEHARYSSVWYRLDGRQVRFNDPDFFCTGEQKPEDTDGGVESYSEAELERLFGGETGNKSDSGASSLELANSAEEKESGGTAELEQQRFLAAQAEKLARARKLGTARPGDSDYWLSPIDESVALACLGPEECGAEFRRDAPRGMRFERGGFLPMTLDQYLELLDWTGRQVRRDKKGSIPADAPPILERLGVKPEDWCEVTSQFGDWYKYAAGTADRMNEHAQKIGRRPFKGTRESRRVFGR